MTNTSSFRQHFSRSAETYDAAAFVQRQVAEKLLRYLPGHLAPRTILDAGSGTGHNAFLLEQIFPKAELWALDFAFPMLQRQPRSRHRVVGNLEALPFAGASIDLYWSSLAAQWCSPCRLAEETARVLKPRAMLALTTLGPGTFRELAEAFDGIDRFPHMLDCTPQEQLPDEFESHKIAIQQMQRQIIQVHYPDLRNLLNSLKWVGASGVGRSGHSGERRRGLLGRSAWEKIETRWEALRTPRGLPLSYEVIFITGQKK